MDERLEIIDTLIGSDKMVKHGDYVKIHYLGKLKDGTEFDSSYKRGEPLETQIGVGMLIRGWDLGIVGMQIGGKRTLNIPSHLAYGSKDLGVIPPNSDLIFDVELIEIL